MNAPAVSVLLRHDANSIIRLIEQQLQWLDSQQLGAQKRLRLETHTGERDVFGELSERVETLFDRLDAVFLDAGLANVNIELQSGVVKSDELGSMFLEVVDCKLAPFNVHAVASALWKTLNQASMTVSNGVYQVCTTLG